MVKSCAAYGCTNVWRPDINRPYHSFPFKRPAILEKWIDAVRLEGFTPTAHSVLCSEHFRSQDYSYQKDYFLWVKLGEVTDIRCVGTECILFASGCHLVFFELTTRRRSVLTANGNENGEGIACFAGHNWMNLYAYAEICASPSLIIGHYPSLKRKSTLQGPIEGYLALTFSQSYIIIALTNLPYFNIVVWDWMHGEKLATKQTDMLDMSQEFRCNYNKPLMVAQRGNTWNRLNVWDVLLCGKRCVITRHRIRSPTDINKFVFNLRIVDMCWNSDGTLLSLSTHTGDIYMVNPEKALEKVIECDIDGHLQRRLCWYKNGLTISGPDHKIRHYIKTTNWTCDWTIEMDKTDPVMILICNRLEFFYAITEKYSVLQLHSDVPKKTILICNESRINNFCLLYPKGQYVVTLCHRRDLLVYELITGTMVAQRTFKIDALELASNPELPYVAVCYETGILELFSLYDPSVVKSMASFHLTRNPLNSIYFSEQGRVLITANVTIGEFFIIEGVPGSQMKVVACVQAKTQVVDYILVASKTCYRLFILPVTSDKHLAGNKIIRYCVIKYRSVNRKEYEFENSKELYHKLHPITGPDRDRIFYAIPLSSKCIHKVETKRGDDYANVILKIETGHQLGKLQLFIDKYHAITWSYDGLVFVRNCSLTSFIEVAMAHHRRCYGVKKACVDPTGKFVVSLGSNNLLKCIRLKSVEAEEHRFMVPAKLFKRITLGFMPTGPLKGKTWLEVEEMSRIEIERIKCQKKRKNIIEEFHSIKLSLSKLITRNLEGPDNEKLDLLEFNLDKRLYQRKLEENKQLCKKSDRYLRQLIIANNKVTASLKRYFWDTMGNPGKTIFAISGTSEVSNYVLLPVDPKRVEVINWALEKSKFYHTLMILGHFVPWKKYSAEELEDMATNPMKMLQPPKAFGMTKTTVEKSECSDNSLAMAGCITESFIEPFPEHQNQRMSQSFCKYQIHCYITEWETERLRIHFNKQFDEMMERKVKEVSVVRSKNTRLRHIISEINYFSENKVGISIDDPEWRQQENPEDLIKVEDNEVSITPYISPSQQAVLDAEAAEAERIRLLLLADDFRERALMAMMNGVLEVRWEDELRKEVPVPKCLLEKDPATFNEEDIRTVRDYEEKVKFLNSERERYKHLLNVEYGKISSQIRESTRKFNHSLSELLLTKMLIQTAIDQQYLMMNRVKLRLLRSVGYTKRRNEMREIIADNEHVIQSLQNITKSLHGSLVECRLAVDSLIAKEKTMEKSFRRDIIDFSSVSQEQCLKLYKRRPKINLRSIAASRIILVALARTILTNEKSVLLTAECYEFLKGVEAMDQYIGVPSVVDEHSFAVVCKHRRLRIEHEIKIRCAIITLTEAEQTISVLQKNLAMKKDLNVRNANKLAQYRIEHMELTRNIDVQFVMRSGIVEIPTSGDVTDFDDAVLVNIDDVEAVNKIIVEAGDKKLKSLRQVLNFKRRIISMEWEHKKLSMYIDDLKEQMVDISETMVTKEMQAYLKCKSKGQGSEPLPFETEVELLKISFENTIKERKDHVVKLRKQINKLVDKNDILDKQIADMNVDVCEYNLEMDHEFKSKENEVVRRRMAGLIKRRRLMQEIQANHNEILVLQTELELLRLKTYPTLKYKVCE